jgi:hypothetical protein
LLFLSSFLSPIIPAVHPFSFHPPILSTFLLSLPFLFCLLPSSPFFLPSFLHSFLPFFLSSFGSFLYPLSFPTSHSPSFLSSFLCHFPP